MGKQSIPEVRYVFLGQFVGGVIGCILAPVLFGWSLFADTAVSISILSVAAGVLNVSLNGS